MIMCSGKKKGRRAQWLPPAPIFSKILCEGILLKNRKSGHSPGALFPGIPASNGGRRVIGNCSGESMRGRFPGRVYYEFGSIGGDADDGESV